MKIPIILRKKAILPEVLQAINWKLPDSLDVEVKESENGGFMLWLKIFRAA